jgi:hypothetical protein
VSAVPYLGLEMQALDLVAAALAASPAFRALVGAADAEAARAAIVEIDGPPPVTPHALLYAPRPRLARTPGGAWRGPVEVEAHLARPPQAGDSPAASHRRAWNDLHAVRSDLLTHFGRQLAGFEVLDPVEFDLSDGLSGWYDWGYVLALEAQA